MSAFPPLVLRNLSAALCALVLLAPLAAAAQQSPAPAASAPAEGVREELVKPLVAAQDALKARNYAEALAQLKLTDAVADKTAYERFVIDQVRIPAAAGAGDLALAEKSYQSAVASGRLKDDDRVQLMGTLTAAAFTAKDYASSIRWASQYAKDGGTLPSVRTMLIQSYYLSSDFAATARELDADVNADLAAGRAPTEERLRLLASSQSQAKNDAGYMAALERLVAYHPKKEYWFDLLSRTTRKSGFAERLWLDAYRLQKAAAGLRDAGEYTDVAQMAQQAGYPIEARELIEQGYAASVLGIGPQAAQHKALRERFAKAAADDLKSLAPAASAGARDGNVLASTGLNLVFAGQPDKGLPMMEEGLAKGGLRQPEDMRLRLGMAYVLAGQKDKALATLAAVKGGDGTADLARLWTLHAQRALK